MALGAHPLPRWQRAAAVNAAAYVLDFQRDGSLAVQADCNTGKGSYMGNGTNVTLGTLTGTQAMCSGTSLSDVFLQQLQTSGTGVPQGRQAPH